MSTPDIRPVTWVCYGQPHLPVEGEEWWRTDEGGRILAMYVFRSGEWVYEKPFVLKPMKIKPNLNKD